jgi:hypothetical protein
MRQVMYQSGKAILLAALFTGTALVSPSVAQNSGSTPGSPSTSHPAASAAKSQRPRHGSPYRAVGYSTHAKNFYKLKWGVEPESVKQVSSGTMIKFTYRVVDANKAKALNDKANSPYLIDPQARVRLVIPTMEKIGQLRQTAEPEAGKVYWMVFSNKEGFVKQGARVNVVIGKFHIDGLVVE